jgi:hypothetical protein
VDRLTAAIAIAFLSARADEDVIAALADSDVSSIDSTSVSLRIKKLQDLQVLQPAQKVAPRIETLQRWAQIGWGEPFDYLASTWDYPFEDYSRGGQEVDKKRMTAYAEVEPDNQRMLPLKGAPDLALPDIDDALGYFSSDLDPINETNLLDHILNMASVAALPIVWKQSRTPGADYMKRTSPSGGCRHPSELYILALDVPGLSRGAYHVGVGEARLGRLRDLPSTERLRVDLPGAFRLGAPPRLVFIVSTEFGRNMYRYREARTLRTVYYDAGHLGGLLETLGDRAGSIAHGHHGFRDSAVKDLIQSPSLAIESPSYLVSVGLESELPPELIRVGS